MVMEGVHEDMGEGNMQCANHPYRNSSPGGICACCLQEKLGKLVSSSFSVAIFPSSTSSPSSSPSFRSDIGGSTTTAASTTGTAAALSAITIQSGGNGCNYHDYYTRRSRLPFVLTHRKKKKNDGAVSARSSDSAAIAFKRSKSTTIPRRGMHFLDENYAEDYSPHRKGFWSFLYLSKNSTTKKNENIKHYKDLNFASATPSTTVGSSSMKMKSEDLVVVDENGSPDEASYDIKVSRSRSVGCGSRSFSGDFFERISTGFGDCTLRRVESQREGKPKAIKVGGNSVNNGQDCIKGRVRCGGLFSGFMINSSSSSYWDNNNNVNGKRNSAVHSSLGHISHGRSKSWGWALASPMRAFSKPSSAKKEANSRKGATPNLAAIPSLLAVSG